MDKQYLDLQRKYESLLYRISDAVIVINTQGNIATFNKAAEQLTGHTDLSALGKSLDKLIQISESTQSSTFEQYYSLVAKQPTEIFEKKGLKLIGANGKTATVNLTITQILEPTRLNIGYILVLQDITKEDELERTKLEFISLASHELRTPMSIIKTNLWMLLDGRCGPFNDQQKLYLDKIYKSIDRLILYTNNMLDFSRIESKKIAMQMKPLLLDALVNEIISEMKPRITELGLAVKITPFPNLPAVMADKERIREVVTNLMTNALKFSSPGGTITISFDTSLNMVQTNIIDNGTGMNADDIPKLFHKLETTGQDSLPKPITWGAGIGLYICRGIIELHGGRIWANSEGAGKGSIFSFTLRSVEEAKKVIHLK